MSGVRRTRVAATVAAAVLVALSVPAAAEADGGPAVAFSPPGWRTGHHLGAEIPAAPDEVTPLAWPARRLSPCGAYDPDSRRLVAFGGREEGAAGHLGDTWALELGSRRPEWTLLAPPGAPSAPPAVRGCGAAYDGRGQRLLVFGGTGNGGVSTNGVWALSLDGAPTWTQLCDASSCGPSPSPRRSAPASFDPVHRRLVVYGGLGASFTDDLWYLHLDASPRWERVATAGPTPGPRAGHSQVLDAERGVLWLFGGTRTGADLNDVWALDLATSSWRLVLSDGCADPCPSRRSGATLVHDTTNDQLVLWGGLQSDGSFAADVRGLGALDGTPQWRRHAPDSAAPQPRFFHLAAYDPAGRRMVVFGGGLGASAFKDTAALLLPTGGRPPAWRGVAPAVPLTARDQAAVHLEPDTGQLYAFGGFGAGTFPGAPHAGVHLAETRRLDLDRLDRRVRWRDATSGVADEVPLSREAAASASDTAGHRWFLVGGLSGDDPTADAWMADFDRGGGRAHWRQLCAPPSCGPGPAARWGASAVYDPVGDRVVLFGGMDGAGGTFADAWALDLGGLAPEWERLDPTGASPAPRWGAAAGYDPVHRRLVVTAGQSGPDAVATSFGDTWALSLDGAPVWSLLATAGPSPRRSPAAAVATEADGGVALLLTGGYQTTTGMHHDDVWRLGLDGDTALWEQLAPDACADPAAPACRRSHSAEWDPVGERLVVVFGRDAQRFYDDVWTFSPKDGWHRAP